MDGALLTHHMHYIQTNNTSHIHVHTQHAYSQVRGAATGTPGSGMRGKGGGFLSPPSASHHPHKSGGRTAGAKGRTLFLSPRVGARGGSGLSMELLREEGSGSDSDEEAREDWEVDSLGGGGSSSSSSSSSSRGRRRSGSGGSSGSERGSSGSDGGKGGSGGEDEEDEDEDGDGDDEEASSSADGDAEDRAASLYASYFLSPQSRLPINHPDHEYSFQFQGASCVDPLTD